jgi:hypothetical protein
MRNARSISAVNIAASISVNMAFGPAPNAIGIGPMNIITPVLVDALVFESIVAVRVMIIPVAISANPRMRSALKSLVLSRCEFGCRVIMCLFCLPMLEAGRAGS